MEPGTGCWRLIGRMLVAVSLSGAAVCVLAATLVVDASGGTPYTTIQSAIDAAVPVQDDVFVRCGTYVENVVMRDSVTVRGAGESCAVIDGGQNGSTVTMIGVGSSTRLEGFTIRNGRSGLGGGIYIEQASPLITRNVITGNSAVDTGGLTGYGGGIHVTAPLGLGTTPAPVITRNVIQGNRADKFGGGIEIYSDDGSTISNNLIMENSAVEGGGGIDVFASFPAIINNTIVRNCLQGAGTACAQGGGGIALTLSGVVQVANNVIAWNEAEGGGGGVDQATSTSVFQSNDAFANQPLNYAGVSNPTGAAGNIALDPLFVDQRANRRSHQPRSNSPLIDAAAPALAPADDLPGVGRPLDGDADGAAAPDIGARENEGSTRLRFEDASSLVWDLAADPSSLYNLYRGDMQVLRATGIYTQDPGSVAGARRWCDLPAPSAFDLDQPDAGELRFYLAVLNNAVEGTLGFDSSVTERPYTAANRCP